MNKQQPEALRFVEQYDHGDPATHGNAWKAAVCAELLRQHARITELEPQLAQRFDAADMATAAAQGFRDGVAAPQPAGQATAAQAGAPANMQVTEKMRAAGDCAWMTADRVDSARVFRAMLAAAPAQPAAPPSGKTYEVLIHDLEVIARTTLHATVEGSRRSYERDAVRQAIGVIRASHVQAPAGAGEPFGYFHQLLNHEGKGNGVWLGAAERKVVEQAHTPGETSEEIVTLYTTPQPTQMQAGAVPLTDEYPALVCDYCGALTPDPWHSSGMLHGKMSKHIHSCDACAARGAATAQAAKQQEQLI